MVQERKDAISRTSLYVQGRYAVVRKLRKEGKLKAAEAEYRSMLADRLTNPLPPLRLEYPDLLESEGRFSEAMQLVKPLVFTGTGIKRF